MQEPKWFIASMFLDQRNNNQNFLLKVLCSCTVVLFFLAIAIPQTTHAEDTFSREEIQSTFAKDPFPVSVYKTLCPTIGNLSLHKYGCTVTGEAEIDAATPSPKVSVDLVHIKDVIAAKVKTVTAKIPASIASIKSSFTVAQVASEETVVEPEKDSFPVTVYKSLCSTVGKFISKTLGCVQEEVFVIEEPVITPVVTTPSPTPVKVIEPIAAPAPTRVPITYVPVPSQDRVVERTIVERLVSGVTKEYLNERLAELSNSLNARINSGVQSSSVASAPVIQNIYQNLALATKIDNLYNTNIQNPSIVGGSITNGSFSGLVHTDGVTLGAVTAPASTSNLLYNIGGALYFNGSAVGTGGGGSGGGTWATTTSQTSGQLVNYSNNDTDVVAIGSNSSTTAEIFFDPNLNIASFSGKVGVGTTSPYAKLSVVGEVVSAFYTATTTATSTFTGGLNIGLLNVASTTASSTFANGINLTAGCFAVNGTCVGGSSGSGTVGTGTTGQLPFYASGGTTLSATSSLFMSATGNVGVGTTSPYAKLSVAGETVAAFFTATTTATSTFGGGLAIGSNVMNILTSGRIGIGTSAPVTNFHIAGGNQTPSPSNYGGIYINPGTSDAQVTVENNTGNEGGFFTHSNGNMYFGTWSNNPLIFRTNNIDALTLATNGNLTTVGKIGIGTTTPYAALSVVGETVSSTFTATSTSATSTIAGGFNVGGGSLVFDYGGNYTSIANLETGASSFDTDAGFVSWSDLPVSSTAPINTPQGYTAHIDGNALLTLYSKSDGIGGIASSSVGIGTTTPYGFFSVEASSTAPALVINQASTTLNGPIAIFSASSTERARLTLSGNFGLGTTTPTQQLSASGLMFIGGTGTSTIQSNLHVVGTLRSTLSYVGDLVFSNEFRFVEAATSSIPQALFLNNQHGINLFAIDENGNMGLGTTTPQYKLHVLGDVAATSFVNISTRSLKKDITYVTSSEEDEMLAKITNLKIARYRYNDDSATSTSRLGLIAEESPAEILSAAGNGVDVYKLTTFALAGMQAQQRKIDALEIRMNNFSPSGAGGGISFSSVLAEFESLGARISQGNAMFKAAVAESLTVGSAARPVGITLYDEVTGSPYCLSIANGAQKTTPGLCTAQSTTTPQNPTPQVLESDAIAPVITIVGENPATVIVGSVYEDAGATATDNITPNLTVLSSGLPIDTTTPATYMVQYSVNDQAGNQGTAARTVNVVAPDPNLEVSTSTVAE